MRRSMLLGVAFPGVVVALSWGLGGAMSAQATNPWERPYASARMLPRGTPPPVPPPGAIIADGPSASFGLSRVLMTRREAALDVSCEGTFRDTTSAFSCLWGLQVEDSITGEVVVSHHYANQTFRCGPEVSHPTFFESLILPPGSYTVRVMLFRVPPGDDPDEILQGGSNDPRLLALKADRVTIH